MEETVVLWRPVNQAELDLVAASGWRPWPPRLPDQPIFYPVCSEEYATRIAREWNVPAYGVGHVTRFRVRRAYLDEYEPQEAGGRALTEYWIPAEDLGRLNDNVVGPIELVATYTADDGGPPR
jgi:hypothetical protein